MEHEIVPKKINQEQLIPILRKVLTKSKAAHPLRYDPQTQQIRFKEDKLHLGLVYLEAPYIALPNYDRLRLIQRGKCCSYCGEVLKLYDNGKMKDDGNKSCREKKSSLDKHERYVNGLDCSNCEGKWCDKQCKSLDFKHDLLYHRPSNKTASHVFHDCDGNEVDVFYYDNWKKLEGMIFEKGMDLCYMTIMTVIHSIYDPELKHGFESLVCLDSNNVKDYEHYLNTEYPGITNDDYRNINSEMNNCFKSFKLDYATFLKYLCIFKMNNYNGSIYLIFSSIKKSNSVDPNIKIEYFNGEIDRDYEEFTIKTNEDKSVRLVKNHVKDESFVKPIYTNRRSGIIDKKILQVMNTTKIYSESEIVLPDIDYSNPIELEDDDIGFISDSSESHAPIIILPVSNPTKRRGSRIRNSFTSSGTSFGEGIIKYNRDQIREMLENMADTLNEESSDDSDVIIDENIASTDIFSMVKNLHITPHTQQRRKSVKFEEVVTTI